MLRHPTFGERQSGILPCAKAAAKRLDVREPESRECRDGSAAAHPAVAIDDHRAGRMLRDLAAAVLELGQRDVDRVRQPSPGQLAGLAHVEHDRILLVEQARGGERRDVAGGCEPALHERPQQERAGNDEHQDERPVRGDEFLEDGQRERAFVAKD